MSKAFFLLVAGASYLVLLSSQAQAQPEVILDCNEWSSLTWPADNPVWELEFRRPALSSGRDGSGLEIRNVRYLGRLVLSRGHTPIVNVQYEPGGCGCFRDWSDSEVHMAIDGVAQGCYASSQPGGVQTTCDLPAGGDIGNFRGVAAEDYGDRLVLSTHLSAGWYRYRMFWIFHENGKIEPRYSFTAASNTCTSVAHRHHVYWRLDFDIETADNNSVVEFSADQPEGRPLLTEQRLYSGPKEAATNWVVFNTATERGYRITPSEEDLLLPPDSFSDADGYVLRYRADASGPLEIDDGGGQCAINFGPLLNNESVADTDLVFWYRTGAYHEANDPWTCDLGGPSLTPVGDWGTPVSVDPGPSSDDRFTLSAPFPNPSSAEATITFSVAEEARVQLLMYDALGRQVRVLYDDAPPPNLTQEIRYNTTDLPAGTYTLRLVGPDFQGTVRSTVLR